MSFRNTLEMPPSTMTRRIKTKAMPMAHLRRRRMSNSTTSSSDSSDSSITAVHISSNNHTKVVDQPTPREFAQFEAHIQEAKSVAQTLTRLVILKAPYDIIDNEMIKDCSEKCQSMSKKMKAYMQHPALLARADICKTKTILAEADKRLDLAIGKHQRAILHALQVMGVSADQINAAVAQPAQSEPDRLTTPTQQSFAYDQAFSFSQMHLNASTQSSPTNSSRSSSITSDSDSEASTASSSITHAYPNKVAPTEDCDSETKALHRHVLRQMYLTRTDKTATPIPSRRSTLSDLSDLHLPSAMNRLLFQRLIDLNDSTIQPNGELRHFAEMAVPEILLSGKDKERPGYPRVDSGTA